MARVLISLPDELLARIDAEARRRGTTRSAVLCGYTAAALEQRSARLGAAMRDLVRPKLATLPGGF